MNWRKRQLQQKWGACSNISQLVLKRATSFERWTEVFPISPIGWTFSSPTPPPPIPPAHHPLTVINSICNPTASFCLCGFFRPIVAYFFTNVNYNHNLKTGRTGEKKILGSRSNPPENIMYAVIRSPRRRCLFTECRLSRRLSRHRLNFGMKHIFIFF